MAYLAVLKDEKKTEEIMKNRGILTLQYDKLEYTYIRQFYSMTMMDVVANFGGYMGLFLGGSLLSILHSILYFSEKVFEKIFTSSVTINLAK